MVRPYVRPPKPQRTPKNTHQPTTEEGTCRITPIRSLVWIAAKTQGAITQEKMPPVSQKISQFQRFTPR